MTAELVDESPSLAGTVRCVMSSLVRRGTFADAGRKAGTGLTVALFSLVNSFAYSSFLASGKIVGLLPTILCSALMATAVMSLVLTRFHSKASALGGPAGNAAAVVGAALTTVLAHDSNAGSRSADVAVVLALSALLPGIAMLTLRHLQLGRIIRYVPYPVLAGFLAGTGWLLVRGSARIADATGPLVCAMAFMVALRAVQQRWNSPFLIPAGVALATAVVHGVLTCTHVSLATARAAHWLYPELAAAGPAIVTPAALLHANWSAIGGAWSAFAWIVIVVTLVSMLNTTALESETGADTDTARDMAAVGAANVATSLCGGFGSQLLLPTSLLAVKAWPGSRVPGYIVAIASLLLAFVASSIIAYLPTPVFAGLIAYLGLRLLEQHALGALRTMPRLDALAVVAMLAATALAGLQAALVVGLAATSILCVIDAARHRVVASILTLAEVRSDLERSPEERAILERVGGCMEIVRLEGQLFFGSAHAMYETLRPSVHGDSVPAALVLDFAHVHSIDVSAAMTIARFARHARSRGTKLVVSDLAPPLESVLRKASAFVAADERHGTIDAALQACETMLLESYGLPATNPNRRLAIA